MKISEKIEINRPPKDIWPFIEDPEKRKLWNEKLKDFVPLSTGPRRAGFQFRVSYVMKAREKSCQAEITVYEPPTHLRIQMTEDDQQRGIRATEDYRLTPTPRGTLMEQNFSLQDARINPLLRILIWFLLRFGKPVDEPYLQTLKRLVESAEPSAVPAS